MRSIHGLPRLFVVTGLLFAQAATAQEGTYEVTPDVVYGHKDGMALTFDLFEPSGSANGAGVLYMVSGGWVSRWAPPERYARAFGALLERGFTVFAVRHGSSPRYKVPEATVDVERALGFIRDNAEEFGVNVEHLGVYGGSAGGHLSLMLGLAPERANGDDDDGGRVAAVVAYYPPVDLRRLVGPSRDFPALDFAEEEAPEISPIRFVTASDPPTLLIHGDADRLVPLRNSEVLYDSLAARGVPAELIVIAGGDHGFSRPEDRQRAQSAMVEWFERHLLPVPRARE